VHAAAAPGCVDQAGAAHQAGRDPGRRRQRARAPSAPAAGGRRARASRRHHRSGAGQAAAAIPVEPLGHHAQRHHPSDPGPHQGIPRLRGGQRRQPERQARRDPCPDRTQRGRQDHGLQPAHQVPHPDPRRDRLRRRRHHRRTAGADGAARHRALVPDLGGVPAIVGPRD
ncbi:hypothetical protein OY671_009731, partial [Metschnikowia pulcherrima]